MKKLVLKALLMLAFLGSPMIVQADSPITKFPIEIVSQNKDSIGQRITYNFKEYIRRSTNLRITTDDELRIRIRIKSMFRDYQESSTVYSVIWVLMYPGNTFEGYINDTFGICGAEMINDVAEGLIADTDLVVQYVQEVILKPGK